jgi:hypothetical protein
MTPKEAIEALIVRCDDADEQQLHGDNNEWPNYHAETELALDTITHYLIPRTEPPTVDEVGENEQCLVVHLNGFVGVEYGKYLRRKWQNGVQWLPIPEVTP